MIIAFDFDGTLLDSTKRHTNLLRDILSRMNVHIPHTALDYYQQFKANGLSTQLFLEQNLNDGRLIKKICNEWVSQIEELKYLRSDFLYSDAVKTLEYFRNKGFDLVLISSRQHEDRLLWQVLKFKLSDFFYKIVCVSPKNAVKEKAVALKNCKADFMIGDSEVDCKSAKAAGIPVYLLNRGFRNREYWDMQSINSFNSLGDIVNFLELCPKI